MGRQVRLADGVDHYEPLTTIRGLPVFPNAPLADQIDDESRNRRPGITFRQARRCRDEGAATGCRLRSRRSGRIARHGRAGGAGTDHRPPGMARHDDACAHRRHPGIPTVAAAGRVGAGVGQPRRHDQWLRCAFRYLGVDAADVVGRGVARTTIAHGPSLTSVVPSTPCGRPPTTTRITSRRCRQRVLTQAVDYLDQPCRAVPARCGDRTGVRVASALRRKRQPGHLRVEHPARQREHRSLRSVRAVGSGSDKYRLRSDESGYDNLVLAGDWTDSGMNAGCIEAAVMSGLQAANALLGRGRYYRIRGFYMP